jgi:hypothetical protein
MAIAATPAATDSVTLAIAEIGRVTLRAMITIPASAKAMALHARTLSSSAVSSMPLSIRV